MKAEDELITLERRRKFHDEIIITTQDMRNSVEVQLSQFNVLTNRPPNFNNTILLFKAHPSIRVGERGSRLMNKL